MGTAVKAGAPLDSVLPLLAPWPVQRASSKPRGRGEGWVMLGGYSKCILLGAPHSYFCLYRGFTHSSEFLTGHWWPLTKRFAFSEFQI